MAAESKDDPMSTEAPGAATAGADMALAQAVFELTLPAEAGPADAAAVRARVMDDIRSRSECRYAPPRPANSARSHHTRGGVSHIARALRRCGGLVHVPVRVPGLGGGRGAGHDDAVRGTTHLPPRPPPPSPSVHVNAVSNAPRVCRAAVTARVAELDASIADARDKFGDTEVHDRTKQRAEYLASVWDKVR